MTKTRAIRHLPTSPFNAPAVPPTKTFDMGDRVLHAQHGLGRIIGLENGIAALVDFGTRQVRVTEPYTSIDKI